MYVDAAYRRRGVYRALHAWMRDAARNDPLGCGIRLYVERDNLGAQATYRHLGMHQTAYDLYEEEFPG